MHQKTSRLPVIPLLFICPSRKQTSSGQEPYRYNRRNLSQPYPRLRGLGALLGSHLPDHTAHTLSAWQTTHKACRALSVRRHKMYSLRHCIFLFNVKKSTTESRPLSITRITLNYKIFISLRKAYCIYRSCHRSPTDNCHR